MAQSVKLHATGWMEKRWRSSSRRSEIIFLLYIVQTGQHSATYPMGTRGSFLGGKVAGA
jgi:hypothetical protein